MVIFRTDDPQKEVEDKRYLVVLQIASRLVTFARRSAISSRHPAVIRPVFKPTISDSASHTGTRLKYICFAMLTYFFCNFSQALCTCIRPTLVYCLTTSTTSRPWSERPKS